MNNYIYTASVILGLLLLVFYVLFLNPYGPLPEEPLFLELERETIQIQNTSIPVEIADTTETRTQGLSGRDRLDKDTGLLFFFEKPDTYGFWMKDMKFPIDIVWIDETWVIIDITENISPETFPEVFYPKASVQYVLEVNAGFVNENNISIGDVVSRK